MIAPLLLAGLTTFVPAVRVHQDLLDLSGHRLYRTAVFLPRRPGEVMERLAAGFEDELGRRYELELEWKWNGSSYTTRLHSLADDITIEKQTLANGVAIVSLRRGKKIDLYAGTARSFEELSVHVRELVPPRFRQVVLDVFTSDRDPVRALFCGPSCAAWMLQRADAGPDCDFDASFGFPCE